MDSGLSDCNAPGLMQTYVTKCQRGMESFSFAGARIFFCLARVEIWDACIECTRSAEIAAVKVYTVVWIAARRKIHGRIGRRIISEAAVVQVNDLQWMICWLGKLMDND